ncbi:MAG: YlbF family regulator, partial [Anaeroplasmataceae bacterium]
MSIYLIKDELDDLIESIKSSNEYKEFIFIKDKINKEYSNIIKEFNDLKLKYEEVSKYSKYHPDLKNVQILFSNKKKELYSIIDIKEYFRLERILNNNLATI